MNEIVSRILAETWTLSNEQEHERNSRVLHVLRFVDDLDEEPHELVRMQFAAVAPEALRLLLEAECLPIIGNPYDGSDDGCAFCMKRHEEGHAIDCRWLALMKKAGLR